MFQKDKFYTEDHDWLRISGSQAHVGTSKFKLTGFRKIDHIDLQGHSSGDMIPQGTPLLTLHYDEYVIPVHVPMDCRLIEMNCIITHGEWEQIITHPESNGWLVKIELLNNNKNNLTKEQDYRNRFLTISDHQC